MIFEQILSSNRKRNCTKISLENLCEDFVALRVKRVRKEDAFLILNTRVHKKHDLLVHLEVRVVPARKQTLNICQYISSSCYKDHQVGDKVLKLILNNSKAKTMDIVA